MARNKENDEPSKGGGGVERKAVRVRRTCADKETGRQPVGLLRTNAKLCLHLRGDCGRQGGWYEARDGEEIRGNTAELDKPTGFVLSGVRNEDKRGDCGIAWPMAIGPTIACPSELSLTRSFAGSLARLSARKSAIC